MSEQEIREGMLLAVWDEPPLDFDPDTLIRRVEQKKSRRRALVTVGVATAMIVVASFALPGLLPRERDSQLGEDGQPSSSAPPTEAVEKRAERIGVELMERLALADPNLKEVYSNLRIGKFSNEVYPSSTPPRKPAQAPSTEPISTVPTMTAAAVGSESRAPNSVRMRTSRPSVSVPSQWCRLGRCRRSPTVSMAVEGAHHGTVSAMIAHVAITAEPIAIAGTRNAALIAATPSVRGGATSTVSRISPATLTPEPVG